MTFLINKKSIISFIGFAFLVILIGSCSKNEEAQPTPGITSLSIAEGQVGTSVTITGTNFGTVASDVKIFFNTTETIATSVTPTQIVTTVPVGATTGAVKVKVKALEVTGSSFTVLAPITIEAPVPTVSFIAIAGIETETGCTDGTGTDVRFTSPYFGYAVQPAVGPLELYIADLICGARKVTISGFGASSVTATTLQSNTDPRVYEYADVLYFGSYSLITYRGLGNGQGNVLRVPTDGSLATNFSSSTLSSPGGLATDASNNVYVAELRSIKRFAPSGLLQATYGNGETGSIDGAAATAQFRFVSDVQVNAAGDLIAADLYSIRKIATGTGIVSTVAGNGATQGNVDGTLTTARFGGINSIGLLPNGNMIVADGGNNKIKLVDMQAGTVVTLLTFASSQPLGIIVVNNNTFYFTRTDSNAIYKATLN